MRKSAGNIVIIFISLIPLVSLFYPALPLTHDGKDHVARIANFYRNLEEGTIIPRWAGNLNWGYGHPILMFLYPFPSYMASLFHFIGFSFVDSVKLLFGFSYILSGVSMYIWVKNILDKKSALIASVLYLYAPYRFVDLYVRGAIGEHVAFIFPPLICYFLYKLTNKNHWVYMVGGSLSLSGLILSHNAITLMFLPIFLLYGFYLIVKNKNRKQTFTQYLILGFFGFAISSFFWIPAFFEGKYTLRDIVTSGGVKNHFSHLSQFLYGSWNYGGSGKFTVQIGIIHWILILASFITMIKSYKFKKEVFYVLLTLQTIFWAVLLLMTEWSIPIWDTITTLEKFQFPWRFLSVTVFVSSVIGGYVFFYLQQRVKNIFFIVILFTTILATTGYWRPVDYLEKPESYYTQVYDGTTDTGESAPIWSVRFMEKRPKAPLEVIEGAATIETGKRTSTYHSYIVETAERVRIKENTLYFPGWNVLVDGKEIPVQYQDSQHRGLMTFYVEKGKHTIDVVFNETKLRFLANMISGVSIVCMILFTIFYKPLWKRFQ